jgi:segregation and condensation protein B
MIRRAMGEPKPDAESDAPPPPGRFSLERLSSAFARLLGAPALKGAKSSRPAIAIDGDEGTPLTDADDAAATPRMIVEGLLFVGAADGASITSADLAARMRNVEPAEVDALIAELNAAYRDDCAAYDIVSDAAGHRLQLRDQFAPVRQRFRGDVRAAKLTPSALEVLSIVAYRQGVTGEELNRLRGSQSYAILAQLVRRQLVRSERPATGPRAPRYHTTDRFNRLFGVTSPADLPRSEELDDA